MGLFRRDSTFGPFALCFVYRSMFAYAVGQLPWPMRFVADQAVWETAEGRCCKNDEAFIPWKEGVHE